MALAGSLPTSTTASPGGRPLAARAAIRGFSSFLISSRTRFPSRIRGILLNHNVRGCGSMPINRLPGFELRAQRLRRGTGLLPFELLVKLCRDFQKFAIARLPDLQKRPRIEPAFDRSAA